MNKKYKYHYFYKITNLINNHFYYGVHNTNDLNDGYMGSGKRLHYAYKIYGIENFKKEIIKFFDTAKEAFEYEAFIVNENLVKDNNCYNLCEGGKFWKSGHGTKNTISVIDIQTGEKFRCKINDPNYINNRYIGVTTGFTIGFDKNGNSYYVYKDDKRFTTGELIHLNQNKGRIFKDGHSIFVDKKSEDYQNFPKYDMMKNKITVKDNNNKTFVVDKNDPRYISGELKYFWIDRHHSDETKQKIGEKNKIQQLGEKNSQYGTCWIHNDKENKKIQKEELNKYINLGWIKGRKMKF